MLSLIKKSLTEPTLTEAITCKWVNGFQDHGPMVTNFNYEDNVFLYVEFHSSDLFAAYIKIDWLLDGLLFDGGDGFLAEHTTDVHLAASYPVGHFYDYCISGKVDIYADDIYLGSTNIFSVLPATCPVWITEHECIRKGCYWYNDTCNQNPP